MFGVTLADVIALGKLTSAPVTNKAGKPREGLVSPVFQPTANGRITPPDAEKVELIKSFIRIYGMTYDQAVEAVKATDAAAVKAGIAPAAPPAKPVANGARTGLALPVITFNTLPRRS